MVTKTDRALSIGIGFTANLESSSGGVEVDGTVEVVEERGIFLRAGELDYDIRWVPADVAEVNNEITNVISEQIDEMRGLINTFPPEVVSSPRDFLPDRVSDIFVIETVTVSPDSPGEFSESFSFPRAQVLVRQEGDVIERLPSVPVTIEAKPSSAIENFIAGSVNDIPQVTFDIPPRVFIEEVSLSRFNCGVLYGGIDSDLAQIDQQVEGAIGRAETRLGDLQRLSDDIRSVSGVTIPTEPDLSLSLQEVPTQDIRDRVSDDTISQWRERLNSISTDVTPGTTISSLRSSAEGLMRRVEDIGLERCLTQLKGDVENVLSNLDELEQLKADLTNLKDSLDRLLSQLGERARIVRPMVELPCEQRFSGVDRQIDRWEERVSQVSAPEVREVRELVSESDELLSIIENQVDDESCAAEFTRRIRSGTSRLESLVGRVRIDIGLPERIAERRQQLEALRSQLGSLSARAEEISQELEG